jgi:hypothetical protein
MAPRPSKIEKGDILILEVEVLRAWTDGTVTFSLFGHPGLTTISADSPQIVGIERAKPAKNGRRRDDA